MFEDDTIKHSQIYIFILSIKMVHHYFTLVLEYFLSPVGILSYNVRAKSKRKVQRDFKKDYKAKYI